MALAQTLTPHRLLTAEAKGLLFQSTWSWISLTPVLGPQPERRPREGRALEQGREARAVWRGEPYSLQGA